MLYMTREERLLSLENMRNTRDLGGYETQSGGYTKAHKYVRAASPARASEKEIQELKAYGIQVVIDLRSDFEKQYQQNPFQNDKDIAFYEVNLFDATDVKVIPDDIKKYQDLGGVYIYMIEGMKDKFKDVFDIFLKHRHEGILFHCSAGKDRTGVLAALLLDLAGGHDYDIVKDYSESYENNADINGELATMMDDEHASQFLKSSPRYIMEWLDYVRENYGSAKEYLLHIGLSEDDIEDLIHDFVI